MSYAIAIAATPTFARLMRSRVLAERERDYVLAAQCLGAGDSRIMWVHVLPNAVSPLLIQISLAMGFSVLAESALSFLGLGTQPPQPSWGAMLNESRAYLRTAPWFGIFPGVALAMLLLGLNFLSDALRDALDPRRTERMTAERFERAWNRFCNVPTRQSPGGAPRNLILANRKDASSADACSEVESMLSAERNAYMAQVGPGTPMGEFFRRFWLPVSLPEQLAEPDGDPVRAAHSGRGPGRLPRHQRRDRPGRSVLPAPPRAAVLRPQRGVRAALRLPRLEVRHVAASASTCRASRPRATSEIG